VYFPFVLIYSALKTKLSTNILLTINSLIIQEAKIDIIIHKLQFIFK